MSSSIPSRCILPLTAVIAVGTITAAVAEEPVSFGRAATDGKISVNLRYRFEHVDQGAFENRGRASTLRTTLGYRTLWWKRFAAMIEFEDVRDLGLSNDHNNAGTGSLWNGVIDRPVIADPAITEINQAYLEWKALDSLAVRAGRQEILVDNGRLVGNVGWRQNHQSFNGATASFDVVENLHLGLAYMSHQRTATGASRPMSTGHLDGAYSVGLGTLRAYFLSVDYDQEALWRLSTSTIGASFTGKSTLSEGLALAYRLEMANQQDTANNPKSIDVDYLRADLGFIFGKVTLAAGYEILGGSPRDGSFSTPLATIHAFNGWADRFLATPGHGLRDIFASSEAILGRWSLLVVYHHFSADTGGSTWGTEFDGQVLYLTSWRQMIGFKFAAYRADEWASDTTKFWLWTQWGF